MTWPSEAEKDRIVNKLVQMCRDGKLKAVWSPMSNGVPIRRTGDHGAPELVSWKEAAKLAGMLRVVSIDKHRGQRRKTG